jgi:LmbE family N-acetylglucosaminyl deacetylase
VVVGVSRLVVVAPHPDDEVLMAGGLMRQCPLDQVVIVAVTDGEASHARSTRVTPEELRVRRAAERTEALRRLDVDAELVRLGAPDQGCRAETTELAASLAGILHRGDVVVGPSRGDRHPDHVAVGDALLGAARGVVGSIWEAPTWALVHGTWSRASFVLALDAAAWAAKRDAVAAYVSQLAPLGPDPADGPVVHPGELATMLRRREEFLAVEV